MPPGHYSPSYFWRQLYCLSRKDQELIRRVANLLLWAKQKIGQHSIGPSTPSPPLGRKPGGVFFVRGNAGDILVLRDPNNSRKNAGRGGRMDYLTILIVVSLALVIIGVVWLHFG